MILPQTSTTIPKLCACLYTPSSMVIHVTYGIYHSEVRNPIMECTRDSILSRIILLQTSTIILQRNSQVMCMSLDSFLHGNTSNLRDFLFRGNAIYNGTYYREGEPGNVIQNLYHCMCVYIALILHTQVGSYGLISLIRTL